MADKLLRSIKFPTLPDRYVIGDSTLTEEGAAAEAKAVGDALATKADTSGTYEDLIVGGAEQLMSDEYETDKDPYLFRPTGGSADVGNREYLDKIVGGTVAWNQLVPNALSDGSGTASANYTTIATLTESNDIIPVGHKILVTGKIKSNNGTGVFLAYSPPNVTQGGNAGTTNTSLTSVGFIYSVDANYTGRRVRIVGMSGDTATWEDVQLHDLTALFNPTIADYIYSLEQANAGAGVAWFKKLFPKDYYPYDPGTLRSVEGVSAHETVGFNQWDEEWESGAINGGDGQNNVYATKIRSKNYIPVFPNTNYYFQHPTVAVSNADLFMYDADKNYLGYVNYGVYAPKQITTPQNAHYMRFSFAGTTYNHDICINLSDPSRNGEYEPYQKHTYQLDSSLTLRGVPKLDSQNNLYYDGDRYLPDGTVERRYGIVDLGTLKWSWQSTWEAWYTNLSGAKRPASIVVMNAISEKYEPTYLDNMLNNHTVVNAVSKANSSDTLVVRNGSDSTQPSGMLVYELATPTTETADGYEQYQRCDPSGTEEFVTDSIVPVGHETRYPHDLKKKIETAPDSPSTDGTYLMKRSGGKNAYMALPSTPSANGAYVLTVTVSGGNATYSWTKKE